MPHVNLSKTLANKADFRDAEMVGANLSDGQFTDASFRGADLTGARLTNAVFGGADFRGADLSGTSLAGADLSRSEGLTQGQINDACSDAETRLPAGLSPRLCKGRRMIMIGRNPASPRPPAPPAPPAAPRPPAGNR
jgi:uncharacterized protein YjbI with pentapeptide repeats